MREPIFRCLPENVRPRTFLPPTQTPLQKAYLLRTWTRKHEGKEVKRNLLTDNIRLLAVTRMIDEIKLAN